MLKRFWLLNAANVGCLIGLLLIVFPAIGQQINNPTDTAEIQKIQTENVSGVASDDTAARFWISHNGDAETYMAICQQPTDKDQADLCQQWRMAQMAEQQVALINNQIFLTIGEVALLIATLGFSIFTALRTDKTSRRQLRAYVSVNPGEIIQQDNDKNIRFEFQPIFQNVGQTPAYDLWYKSHAGVFSFPLPADFAFDCPHSPWRSSMTLGSQQWRAGFIGVDQMLSDSEIAELKGPNNKKLMAYGTVYYRDTFGKKHQTNFCFCAVWGSAGIPVWISADRHNDAT